MKRSSQRNWLWGVVIIVLLSLVALGMFGERGITFAHDSFASSHAVPNSRTVTLWIQATDSCAQALSGGNFIVQGPGTNITTGLTGGASPKTLPAYKTMPRAQRHCPVNQGTCVKFSAGCVSLAVPVPATGTAQYTVTTNRLPPGHGTNVSYAPCEGGPACHMDEQKQPIKEVAFVTVAANGSVQAWTRNTEPDGYVDRWPASDFFSATPRNPIMFHYFGVAASAHGPFTCDGDGDADDFMTGTSKWAHCDNDGDKKH
ncbi:hypothetical protein [Reticulibacter mediterranei]|nr:hypothetical protein [Reticulibacter mediterranei]